jgi:sortase A
MNKDIKKTLKILSFILILTGISMLFYVFFPLISWQIYFAPTFAAQNVVIPIPKYTVVSDRQTLKDLIKSATDSIEVDYNDASNWFPTYKFQKSKNPTLTTYTISIPKINIKNAYVSTVDTDLANHLVNYIGTSFPPQKGNAVVFGHSTLPQFYDKNNYKTIFTYLYKLSQGDEIMVNVQGKQYKYKVENIIVVDPDNTSVLEQNYDDSFLTLVTCTPPGTIWKRLVVKARIETI